MTTTALRNDPRDQLGRAFGRWGLPALVLLSALACARPFVDPFDLPKRVVLELGAAVALVVWATRRQVDLRPLRTPLGRAALVWLGVWGAATAFSVAPVVSFFGAHLVHQGLLTQLVSMVSLLVAAQSVRSAEAFDRLATALWVAGTVTGAYAILQLMGIDPVGWSPERRVTISTLGHANHLAEYLVMALPFGAWCWWRRRGTLRSVALVGIQIQAVALVVSQARAPLVTALFVGALVGALLLCMRGGRRRIGWLCGLLPLLAALAFLASMLLLPWLFRDLDRTLSQTMARGEPLVARQLLWGAATRMILDRPLLGWGPDTFKLAYPGYRVPALDVSEGAVHDADSGHNHLVVALTAAGALGGLAFLLFHVSLAGTLLRSLFATKASAEGWRRTALLVLFAVWAAYLLLFSAGLPRLLTDWLLWVVAGAAIGLTVPSMMPPGTPVPRPPVTVPALVRGLLGALLAGLLTLDAASSLGAELAYGHSRAGPLGQPTHLADLSRAVALRPTEPVYRTRLGQQATMQGRADRDVDGVRRAADEHRAAIALSGERSPWAFVSLAATLAVLHELDAEAPLSPDDVARQLERAVTLDPRNPLLHAAAAEVALVVKDEALARRYLERALALAATPDALSRVGDVKLALGDAPAAYELLTTAASGYSRGALRAPFYRSLGAAALAVGRHDEAIQAYARALELEPNHVPTLLEYGRALLVPRQP